MQIYLPIAEMAVRGEIILLLGACVGFLSGVFGVGGGFLSTPFLIFLGLPPPIAVGTQASQLVASSLSGMLGYLGRQSVDIKMAAFMLSGSVPGALGGIMLFKLLTYIGQIDLVIPVMYVVLLGIMGTLMLVESVTASLKKEQEETKPFRLYHHPWFQILPYKVRFPRSRIYVSLFVPAGIGFLSGILVSLMGVGSGFLLVPAMIYILGMPSLLVAGTSLFHICVTSIFVTIMHAVTNNAVDLILAFLLIGGSVLGAQAGVRVASKIPGTYARVLLALILLAISLELASELFIRPLELYSTAVRGR